MFSVVLIVPAAQVDKANTLAEVMGWGPQNYSVQMAATAAGPATHYGLHTWAQQSFLDMLSGAGQGVMPPELVAAGYPEADFVEVMAELVHSVRSDMQGHFEDVAAAQGLQLVEH